VLSSMLQPLYPQKKKLADDSKFMKLEIQKEPM
jgi:hypothetical protein